MIYTNLIFLSFLKIISHYSATLYSYYDIHRKVYIPQIEKKIKLLLAAAASVLGLIAT